MGCGVRATYDPLSIGGCSAGHLHSTFIVRGIVIVSRVGIACSVCSHFVFNNTVPMGGMLGLRAVSPLGTPCFLFTHRLNIVGINNRKAMAISNGSCMLGFGSTLCMNHNGGSVAFGDDGPGGPTGFCVGSTATRRRCTARLLDYGGSGGGTARTGGLFTNGVRRDGSHMVGRLVVGPILRGTGGNNAYRLRVNLARLGPNDM